MFFIITYSGKSVLEQCFVVRGEGRGKPCKFPFMYEGKEYNSCMIKKNWAKGRDESVCASETDKNRQMKESGICSRSCRNESNMIKAFYHD